MQVYWYTGRWYTGILVYWYVVHRYTGIQVY